MTATTREPLTLAEAQRIAESIVGTVHWRGAEGHCTCPGVAAHTTRNAPTDCKVVCEHTGTVAPGVYCFHGSCQAATDAASYQLRSALGKRSPSSAPIVRTSLAMPKRPATFDPVKLARIAAKLDGIDPQWFAARSPKQPDNRTPASFLHELYAPGEKVIVFDIFDSQGQAVWECSPPPFDARSLDAFRTGKPNGVWYLCNPVSGEWKENAKNKDGSPHYSRRFEGVVTSWRFLVLESDKANAAHWLAALAQLPIPISAIYMSGGKSIHALVRLNAESKAQWDSIADELKPILVTLGADRKAISAVRLTRLPQCERLGSTDEDGIYHAYSAPRMQALIYLNGDPDETPIADKPIIRPGWADNMHPADQDGFNT